MDRSAIIITIIIITMVDNESFDLYMQERKRSNVRKGLALLGVVGCTAFVVISSLHSIAIVDEVVKTSSWYSLVWPACLLIHVVTVYIISTTFLWKFDNRARCFVGCVIASFAAILLSFSSLLSKEWGYWIVIVFRFLQEIGFAMMLYALPAVICTEIPSSAHILIPMYHAAKVASIFFHAAINHWLMQVDSSAPSIVTAIGLSLMAGLSCCCVDSTWDTYRRANERTATVPLKWDVFLVGITSFVSAFNVVYIITSLKYISQVDSLFLGGFAGLTTISSILCLISAMLIGIFIRWLPPRGILYCLSHIATLFGLLMLEIFLTTPHEVILICGVFVVAISIGFLPALMHMHLLDRITERIHGRHHVAAGRVVSVTASLGLLAASAAPVILNLSTPADASRVVAKCIVVPVILTVTALLSVLFTIAVEIQKENERLRTTS